MIEDYSWYKLVNLATLVFVFTLGYFSIEHIDSVGDGLLIGFFAGGLYNSFTNDKVHTVREPTPQDKE